MREQSKATHTPELSWANAPRNEKVQTLWLCDRSLIKSRLSRNPDFTVQSCTKNMSARLSIDLCPLGSPAPQSHSNFCNRAPRSMFIITLLLHHGNRVFSRTGLKAAGTNSRRASAPRRPDRPAAAEAARRSRPR